MKNNFDLLSVVSDFSEYVEKTGNPHKSEIILVNPRLVFSEKEGVIAPPRIELFFDTAAV